MRNDPLTIEQLEIVVLVANGNRIKDISALVYKSSPNIYRLLEQSKRKVGANTLPHLVSLVIASGLLVWSEDDELVVIVDEEKGESEDPPSPGD